MLRAQIDCIAWCRYAAHSTPNPLGIAPDAKIVSTDKFTGALAAPLQTNSVVDAFKSLAPTAAAAESAKAVEKKATTTSSSGLVAALGLLRLTDDGQIWERRL